MQGEYRTQTTHSQAIWPFGALIGIWLDSALQTVVCAVAEQHQLELAMQRFVVNGCGRQEPSSAAEGFPQH